MASPDLTQYLGLAFFDIDPQDAFQLGADHLQREIPDLVLREGHIETLLLEAVAEEVAEAVYAINRIPDGIFEALLKMFGLTRDIGNRPAVNLTFTVNRTDGCTIPVGTSVAIDKPNGMGRIVFTTEDDLFIPPGSTSGWIPAVGSEYSDEANGIPTGTPCDLMDSISFVDYVKTSSGVYGGRDPEDDLSYFSRGVQRLSRMTSTLVLPQHFSAAALENPLVSRAYAMDNYAASKDADGNGPVGNDAGSITIAVWGHGEKVTDEAKAQILESMKPQALSMLKIEIIDAKVFEFNVVAAIHVVEGADEAQVVSQIKSRIAARYSPETSGWDEKVRRNDIISIISQTADVAFVDEVSVPSSDITSSNVGSLASVKDISIEVRR